MRNLFIYPHAPKPVHDSIAGFYGTTPFGGDGIARHFNVTEDPKRADLFWMGQHKDAEMWLLHKNRFPYFDEWPGKHAVELEGDWRDQEFPEWLKRCNVVTGNAEIKYLLEGWRIFVRPIMSPLLMRLVRDPPEFTLPKRRVMWFRGQRDSLGIRERLRSALEISGIPHEFTFNDAWMVYGEPDHPTVKEYVQAMKDNAVALCPRGEGRATCRFYEACAFGRIPIVIADNLWPGANGGIVAMSLGESCSVNQWAGDLSRHWYNLQVREQCLTSRRYFGDVLFSYFRDPTGAFLDWWNSLDKTPQPIYDGEKSREGQP